MNKAARCEQVGTPEDIYLQPAARASSRRSWARSTGSTTSACAPKPCASRAQPSPQRPPLAPRHHRSFHLSRQLRPRRNPLVRWRTRRGRDFAPGRHFRARRSACTSGGNRPTSCASNEPPARVVSRSHLDGRDHAVSRAARHHPRLTACSRAASTAASRRPGPSKAISASSIPFTSPFSGARSGSPAHPPRSACCSDFRWRCSSRARAGTRTLYLGLVMLPFWTSFLVRTYAWMFLLRDTGLINTLLQKLGLIHDPLPLLYNDGAVILGLVYGYLPFTVLPLYATLERLDRTSARSRGRSGRETLGHAHARHDSAVRARNSRRRDSGLHPVPGRVSHARSAGRRQDRHDRQPDPEPIHHGARLAVRIGRVAGVDGHRDGAAVCYRGAAEGEDLL